MVQVVTQDEFNTLFEEVRLLREDLEIYKSLPFAIKLISREQAALMLNKSVQTVDVLIKNRELGYVKGKRAVDVTLESVIEYLKKMKIKPIAISERITKSLAA